MKKSRNPLVFAFAIIAVCVLVYASWNLYQRHEANEQAKAAFSAPPAKGIPDMYHNAPPPPQP